MQNSPYILGGIVVFFILALILWRTVRSMWQVASPNEALIVYGAGGGKDGRTFKIVTGGGTMVLPGIQHTKRLSLNLREAQLNIECVTKQGIPVKLQGVCIYRVNNDLSSITNAARLFLDQREEYMDSNIQNLFDGHFRSIVGTLTVEQLISDRVALTGATVEAAKVEVEALGLEINSLQIKDIGDPTNYIENLAKPHIAAVTQAARIAQANADQAAATAEQDAQAKIAEATAQANIRKANAQAQAESAAAAAAQQGPLAAAQAQQKVVEEQTRLADLQASRVDKELESTVRRPADAEAYKIQKLAEGNRAATIANAQANAQQISLEATAKADAITATGTAEANVKKLGLLAEADGIAARAAAMAQNKEAVIEQRMVELMPEIVKAAAAPFQNVKEMIVANGGDGVNGMITGVIATAASFVPMVMGRIANAKGENGATTTPTAHVEALKS